MARAKYAKKKPEGDAIIITFTDEANTIVSLDLKDLSEDIQHKAALHGISQKLGDSYAGVDSVEEAIEMCTKTAAALRNGEWITRSATGGARVTDLIQALHLATGQPLEACQAKVDEMEDEDIKKLEKHPTVKSHMAAIRAKRAQEAAEKALRDAENAPALAL